MGMNKEHRHIVFMGVPILAALLLLPMGVSRFYVYLVSLIMVTGLLATSLNLVLGFGGMYQFHHAVFYGTGAYALALVVTKTGWPWWIGFSQPRFAREHWD